MIFFIINQWICQDISGGDHAGGRGLLKVLNLNLISDDYFLFLNYFYLFIFIFIIFT